MIAQTTASLGANETSRLQTTELHDRVWAAARKGRNHSLLYASTALTRHIFTLVLRRIALGNRTPFLRGLHVAARL